MEEHEEMELKRQPPSPLQHFIDSIRHSAKAKHAPIYYGTKDLLNGLPGWSSTSNARRSSPLPSVFHSLTPRPSGFPRAIMRGLVVTSRGKIAKMDSQKPRETQAVINRPIIKSVMQK